MTATPPPLRVLIADDERLARLRLRQLLGELTEPRCEVAAEAADVAEALEGLAAGGIDAVLLDIQMPGRSGLQLADALRREPEAPAVIFVTAHAEHALAAFEFEALDYLTKPVRRDRLQAAMVRVLQRRRLAPAVPVLVVTERGRVLRIPVDEVVYLKAELKYVTLRTPSATFLLDDSLAELEQRLGQGVLRIHRNTLVAKKAVRALERRAVEGEPEGGDTAFGALGSGPGAGAPAPGPDSVGWAVQVQPTGEWLPVSRRQLAAVRAALTEADPGTAAAG